MSCACSARTSDRNGCQQPTIAELALLDIVRLNRRGQGSIKATATTKAEHFDDGEEIGLPEASPSLSTHESNRDGRFSPKFSTDPRVSQYYALPESAKHLVELLRSYPFEWLAPFLANLTSQMMESVK